MNHDNTFTYRGTVHHADRLQTFKSGFKKRTVVCFTKTQGRDKEYTNYAVFDAVGDAAAKAEVLKNGDEVEVTFRLAGRAWKKNDASPTMWFGSATAFKVELLSGPNAGSLTTGEKTDGKDQEQAAPDSSDADDYPF